MKNTFELLKNGNVAETVWANPSTREIVKANRNTFGYNMLVDYRSAFYSKYGINMKSNQGKSSRSGFSYSARQMESIGFQLVMRGSAPLWK